MNAYKYKAYSDSQQAEVGRIEAASLEEAEAALQKRGVKIVSIAPIMAARNKEQAEAAKAASAKAKPFSGRKKKTKTEDVITVLRNMAVMAESGVPLKESLDTVSAESGSPDFAKALGILRDQVIGGEQLGVAMRAMPKYFPEVVCDMVAVGEDGGKMDAALSSAADHMERSHEMKSRIINALIYPMILMIVSFLSVIALVVVVLPQFMDTFNQMGIDPPFLTKFLMIFGNAFRKTPLLTAAIIFGLIFGGRYALRQPKINKKIQLMLLKAPVVGELMMKIAISRCIHTLASLTAANIRLVEALEHTAKIAGVPSLNKCFTQAQEDLQHGMTLGESLVKTNALPSTLVQLISIGERTGRLPALLSRAAKQMEREADGRLKAVVSLFEPMLIVVMGGVIGMIVLSIIMPLFSVMQKIN